jgi:Sulfotransferase family
VLVSHSRRLLFIHVPKTGGISLRDALRKACRDLEEVRELRHVRLKGVLAEHPGLTDYTIAGFVRNPWDRLVSWWAMVHAASSRPEDHPHRQFLHRPLWQYIAQFDDFEDFVRAIPSGPHVRFRIPQLHYLSTSTREADFIGRMESMQDDTARLLALIGAPAVRVPHHNRSPRPASYRDLYSPETEEIVRRLYEVDVERFGYRF